MAFSNNETVSYELKKVIFNEKALEGEAAGYALGLVKAGHYDKELAEELINYCRNNPHDRIARATMFSFGLMFLNTEIDVWELYNSMIQDTDPMIRLGAISMLTMRYFGLYNKEVVNQLLSLAATDLSNDIRRHAVVSLGFVMLRKKNKLFSLYKMLSKSYNAHVRHAVALGFGIVFAGSFEKKVFMMLKGFLEDKTDFVRQSAGISLGLLFQLGNDSMDTNFENCRKLLTEKFDKKYESNVAKYGYALGMSLL